MAHTEVTGPDPAGRPRAGKARASTTWLWPAIFWGGAAMALVPWAVRSGHRFAADPLIGTGRVAGILAGYLIAVQLILMSRVLDTRLLSVWHRRLGAAVFAFITVHIVFSTVGHAAGRSLADQTLRFLYGYPWLLAAYVGTALIVMIGLTSIRAIKRRMRYETWYYLHLYAYLGTALAFAHTIMISTDIKGIARVFWIALYGTALTLAVWRRIVRPVMLATRHGFRVSDVVQETPDVTSIHIGGRRMREFRVEPGQFLWLRFLTRNDWGQAHPFSLSAAPDGHRLRVTVKALGDHTRGLQEVAVGTRVVVEGPYGSFTAGSRANKDVLMIAAGIGITPIRALLEEMPPGTVVLYRARSESEIVFRDELDELARSRGARLVYLLDGAGQDGGAPVDADGRRVPEELTAPGLARLVPGIGDRDVYLCGPPDLVHRVTAELRRAGVRDRHIHHDPFEL
ncbi:ferredoxin reductase family protein [Planotetraspora kaengkrachanensis]|uniref:Ferric reductase n=1 Tax=Planotetraspora kaengkrachanensis TaxID=575193 RepID=A0A8J3V7B9_9ACTN|nr:ferredoxin reductase family protein [Planotetraspora kaengkrachanensis]GIG82090.1 ferric reductase [Planotetraspora kaengkrachanensis]